MLPLQPVKRIRGGTGNVYYLDGVKWYLDPEQEWVPGATLRFDQSDATNDFHPLIFSTTTSTVGIISSGKRNLLFRWI